MRVTLRQIHYFVAAAEAGSIARAAARVHISQPAISAAIAGLETGFGLQLFLRHPAQGLSLTAQGQAFLHEAKRLLLQAGELEATALELASKVAGTIEIGCLSTLFPLLVPELMQAFEARHPGTALQAAAGHQVALIARLRTGAIALALTYDLDLPPDIEFVALARLPPYALVSAGHALAEAGAVDLARLAREPFLLLNMPASRDYFLALFHAAGVTPRIAGRFESIDIIRSLVARGTGYGLANVQPRNRASLDGHALVYLPLLGGLRPLALGLATVRGARRPQILTAFAALCRELIRDDHVPGSVSR